MQVQKLNRCKNTRAASIFATGAALFSPVTINCYLFKLFYRVGLASGSRSSSSFGLNNNPRLIRPAIPTKP